VDEPPLVPFSSWFGPIQWWRFAAFAAAGVAMHLALPLWVDAAERQPLLLLGLLVGGASLGVLLGRQDARRARRPVPGWHPAVGMALFGLGVAALVVGEMLSDTFLLSLPLVVATIGAVGVTGARSRDQALAVPQA
jgi:hypothetical protein